MGLDTSADKATMQWIGSLLLYHQTQAVVVNNCFVDRKRLLPYKAARGPMSIDSCIDLCEGFDFAGVENGDECWCGNDYPAEEFQAPMAECSTVCSGDDSQLCGGRWRINIFDVPEKDPRPHEDGDCYDDRTRILSDYRGDNSDTLTIGSCIDLCEGYEYAGTQNGNECWCGNDYPSHDLKRSTASCNKPCSGDDSQLCGGRWRINIYDVPKKDPAPHADGDCFEDGKPRILPFRAARSDSMTVDTCIQLCEGDYKYAGVEAGKECWCGNDYPSSDLKRSTGSCKTPCTGDEAQFCGGSWRLNIYEVNEPVDGSWSNWGEFGECDLGGSTWGEGTQTRSRTCTDPAPACGGADCVGDDEESKICRVAKCATMYSAYPSFKNGDQSIEAGDSEISDLSTFGGEDWLNRVSYVVVEPKCVFEGFQRKNFVKSLGKWRGQLETTNSHEMDAEYENNIMKSFKCKCYEDMTCTDKYTYGSELVRGCPAPECDVAQLEVNDAWKTKVGKKFRYGFALAINIPREYWGSKGWSVLLRFNSARVNNGNFQLWNANFFNFFRKKSGMEVLIHQKYWTKNDLHDEHSFMIIAERLASSDIPEVYFWANREKRHHCFDKNMHSGDRNGPTDFDRAIELADGIGTNEDVSSVKISHAGRIRIGK